MNPIRRASVVAFLDWVQRNHPEIRSLRTLSKQTFLALATAFEREKGLVIDEDHEVFRKWESTQWVFGDSPSDKEAIDRLR
jgi:hypothetical protein